MSIKRGLSVVLIASAVVLAAGVGPQFAERAWALPSAQEPDPTGVTVPYPGRLDGENGQPVANGAYDFAFALYLNNTHGEPLWAEVQEGVPVGGGAFAVLLGDSEPIPAALLADGERWLAVGVRGPGEADFTALNPRQQLSVVAPADLASPTGGMTCPHDHMGEAWSGNGFGLAVASRDSVAVTGRSTKNYGVQGVGGNVGVRGEGTGATTDSAGVFGHSTNGPGVFGASEKQYGVFGRSPEHGVRGETTGNHSWRSGVFGRATGDQANGVTGWNSFGGVGVYGWSETGYAGYFKGDVNITGKLTKASGSFKIDHPLDPENKYLYHSFVESPDMKNVYDGVVELDAAGKAWVEQPDWFEALNEDFRYQLTPIGAPGPNLHIAQEVQNNRFQIAGGEPGMKVSWQVTGIRHDAYAEAHPILVEEEKPQEERGAYLHPVEYGMPETSGLDYRLNQEPEQPEDGGGQ